MTTASVTDRTCVIVPTNVLTVNAHVWESGTRRHRVSEEMMWVQLCLDFNGIQAPFKCLLLIAPLDAPIERIPCKVRLRVENDHFVVQEVFMGQYGIDGSPWAICIPV